MNDAHLCKALDIMKTIFIGVEQAPLSTIYYKKKKILTKVYNSNLLKTQAHPT